MEIVGVAQQVLQALTPQPAGQPAYIAAALRRTLVVYVYAARNLRLHLALLSVAGSVTLALLITRAMLTNSNLDSDSIGRLPFVGLQVLCTLGLFVLLNPYLRRLRHMI